MRAEQAQLFSKWRALEHVLHVQSDVMTLMSNLSHTSVTPSPAVAAAAGMPCPAAKQPTVVHHQHKSTLDPGHAKQQEEQKQPEQHVAAAGTGSSKCAQAADLLCDPEHLQGMTRQWLEPVRLYTLRAALMLDSLGLLPNNEPAHRALAAAHACPAALGPAPVSSPEETAAAVLAAITRSADAPHPAAAAMAAASIADYVRRAWDGSGGISCSDATALYSAPVPPAGSDRRGSKSGASASSNLYMVRVFWVLVVVAVTTTALCEQGSNHTVASCPASPNILLLHCNQCHTGIDCCVLLSVATDCSTAALRSAPVSACQPLLGCRSATLTASACML